MKSTWKKSIDVPCEKYMLSNFGTMNVSLWHKLAVRGVAAGASWMTVNGRQADRLELEAPGRLSTHNGHIAFNAGTDCCISTRHVRPCDKIR